MPNITLLTDVNHNGKLLTKGKVIDSETAGIDEEQLQLLTECHAVEVLEEAPARPAKKPKAEDPV